MAAGFYDQEQKRNAFLHRYQDQLADFTKGQIHSWFLKAETFTQSQVDVNRLDQAAADIHQIAADYQSAMKDYVHHTAQVMKCDYDAKEEAEVRIAKAEHDSVEKGIRTKDAESKSLQLVQDLITVRDQLAKAKKELIKQDVIHLTRQGGRNKCSLYALTWFPNDECKGKLDITSTTTAPVNWRIKLASPSGGAKTS